MSCWSFCKRITASPVVIQLVDWRRNGVSPVSQEDIEESTVKEAV